MNTTERLTLAAIAALGLLAILGGYLGLQEVKNMQGAGAPHGT